MQWRVRKRMPQISQPTGEVAKSVRSGLEAKQRTRELERKLKKTDASLAEAEALLMLRKKSKRSGVRMRKHDHCPGSLWKYAIDR